MKYNKNFFVVFAALSIFLGGCGQSMVSSGDGEASLRSDSANPNDSTGNQVGNEIDQGIDGALGGNDPDVSESEKLTGEALGKANEVLNEVNDTVESEIDVDGAESMAHLDDLKNMLNGKFGKFAEVILKVKEQIQKGRDKIYDQIAILDSNIPAHQQAIEKLNKLLAKLDNIESKVDDGVDLLLGKLDIVDQLFDKLTAKLDPSNIFHFVLLMKIADIKQKVIKKLKQLLFGIK